MREIRARVDASAGLPKAAHWAVSNEALRSIVADGPQNASAVETRPLTEAIILEFGRPALLVKNGSFEVPASDEWKARLNPTKPRLERAIRSVGRLELRHHPTYPWGGTAWMVADNVVATNRHVAELFAERRGRRLVFSSNPEGQQIEAVVDFKEEYQGTSSFEAEVGKIRFVAESGSRHPDMAFLELKPHAKLPPPIPLLTAKRSPGAHVSVIGYPARDPRNDRDAMTRVFGDIFDVKRFSPGLLVAADMGFVVTHDCSTLGGNSGSCLVDVETGCVIGLHFGGQFRVSNYAVKAETLLKELRRLTPKVAIPKPPSEAPAAKPAASDGKRERRDGRQPDGRGSMLDLIVERPKPVSSYANRRGYDPAFLGAGYRVPLPTLSAVQRAAAAKVSSSAAKTARKGARSARSKRDGTAGRHVLDYTHFSVVLNGERRMAYFSAVNIDGTQLRRIPRSQDVWRFDPRVDKDAQVGPEVYRSNDLDRGHLTRRMDPDWGTFEEASQADDDTFHFTNASPQHKDLNQKTWNDLEDYVLDNARAEGLKICVITGPVFADGDREYRGVQLPEQFWKLVAMVREEDQALSATAYVLSQANMLSDLEFAYGKYRTYQVPIGRVEAMTGLKFGTLKQHDPLGVEEGPAAVRTIDGPNDLRLR
jgi:endonuclease G, mitochondrial